MTKDFNRERYGMLVCPFCVGKGFIVYPKRQCCPKCGGFGLIKNEQSKAKGSLKTLMRGLGGSTHVSTGFKG